MRQHFFTLTFGLGSAMLTAQMMFVAGERGTPSVETTTIIENIVHGQTRHIVCIPSYLF